MPTPPQPPGERPTVAHATVPAAPTPLLLEVRALSRSFGGVKALRGVSFTVQAGQIKAVIGPNGAGKTTLFNAICGLLTPDGGAVLYRGENILGRRPYQIARRGISRTFQNLSLFPSMTVEENVMVGRHCRTRAGVVAAVLRTALHRREERAVRSAATAMLELVGLPGRAASSVASLSFGQRRLVELDRALATEPALLLLDEPASGLNTKETEDLAQVIRRIREQGVTILLVEHDMSLVMEVSDSILVLSYGEPIADGDPASIRNDPQVISIYLGGEFGSAPN